MNKINDSAPVPCRAQDHACHTSESADLAARQAWQWSGEVEGGELLVKIL